MYTVNFSETSVPHGSMELFRLLHHIAICEMTFLDYHHPKSKSKEKKNDIYKPQKIGEKKKAYLHAGIV